MNMAERAKGMPIDTSLAIHVFVKVSGKIGRDTKFLSIFPIAKWSRPTSAVCTELALSLKGSAMTD